MCIPRFQSTPSARRATGSNIAIPTGGTVISIHALREEGDCRTPPGTSSTTNFNPRPPRGGRRVVVRDVFVGGGNFNPRPPRGGRPSPEHQPPSPRGISIHALREEGDMTTTGGFIIWLYFNPRPPRGGRRQLSGRPQSRGAISIHALREEGDAKAGCRPMVKLISIHALREEGDHRAGHGWHTAAQFQSTPSARRATPAQEHRRVGHQISIHALREEGDP